VQKHKKIPIFQNQWGPLPPSQMTSLHCAGVNAGWFTTVKIVKIVTNVKIVYKRKNRLSRLAGMWTKIQFSGSQLF